MSARPRTSPASAHGHILALALLLTAGTGLLSTTTACGGCPRTRGAHAHSAHPDATGVLLEERIVIDASSEPPEANALDAAGVHAVISSQTSDVTRCVHAARAEHPALSGEIDLDLAIAADGVVRVAELAANDTGDGVLAACLIALAVHWHFPASPHGARVRVPFSIEDPEPPPQPASASSTEARATPTSDDAATPTSDDGASPPAPEPAAE